jgi:O-antigen/teichoic acid export membrane protein
MLVKMVLLVLSCAVLYSVRKPFSSALHLEQVQDYFALAVIILVLFNLHNLFLKMFEGFLRFKPLPVVNFWKNTSDLLCSLALVWAGYGLLGALLGRLLSLVLAVSVSSVLFYTIAIKPLSGRFGASGTHARQVLGYGWKLALVEGGSRVLGNADRILLNGFLGATVVGLYAVPVRIVELSQMAGLSVATAVAPSLAATDNVEERSLQFMTSLRILFCFYVLLSLAVIGFADNLMALLFTKEYLDATPVLRILAFALPLMGVSPVMSLTLNYLGYAGIRAKIVSTAAGLSILLNLLLIPRWGMIGAAVALVVTQLFYVATQLVVSSRALELHISAVLGVLVKILVAGMVAAAIVLVPREWQTLFLPPWVWVLPAGVAYLALLQAFKMIRFAELAHIITLFDRDQWRES